MKKIEAYIKPFTLEAIRASLSEANIDIFHIFEAQELNASNTYTDIYRGTAYEMDVMPRTALIIFARESEVEKIIQIIQESGQTEHAGDGSIIVSSVEQVIQVDQKEPEAQQS